MPDPLPTVLIVAAGAAVAGFAQGLTGFAFSVVALSFWAWALPPQTAAPLAVFGALTGRAARRLPPAPCGSAKLQVGGRRSVDPLQPVCALPSPSRRHPARRTRTRRVFRAHRRRARRPWRHVRLCPGDLDAARAAGS